MIHFITPMYRLNNLKIVYSSIVNQVENFTWHLIEGCNKIGCDDFIYSIKDHRIKLYNIETLYTWGHEQRNYFISNIPCENNDWCYFLDDDNIITHDLVQTYLEELETNIDLVLFSQKQGLTEKIRLWGHENRLKLGSCDIGSFIIRFKLLKNTYINHEELRNADGHYAENLNNLKSQYNFKFYQDRFVRYNALSLEIL